MTNARVLGHDPLVENGINEDSMVYLVLPFIKSAREGVQRLGSLIEKYGTGESNGIAFSDKDEVWYFETGEVAINGLPSGFLMMSCNCTKYYVLKKSTLMITIALCMRRKLKIL